MAHTINGMSPDAFKQYLADTVFNRKPQEGGFFPLPKFPEKEKDMDTCNDHEHNPPQYLHIPQGQGYKHVCPSCGKVQIVIPPQVS